MVSSEQHLLDLSKEENNELVVSYLTLRNLIGLFGISLPWVLALFPARSGSDYGFEPSISDYFYTDRGDVLVVLLSVLGIFLLTYKGYNKKEHLLTIVAAIGSLGVAFVPTKSKCDNCEWSVHTIHGGIFHNHLEGLHLVFAGLFLLALAVISLVYFRMSHDDTFRKIDGSLTQKGKRNLVYTWCGWIMIGCVGILAIYFLLSLFIKLNNGKFPIIYVFETIAVEAFGISWLTKGQTLWPDGQHYLIRYFKSL